MGVVGVESGNPKANLYSKSKFHTSAAIIKVSACYCRQNSIGEYAVRQAQNPLTLLSTLVRTPLPLSRRQPALA